MPAISAKIQFVLPANIEALLRLAARNSGNSMGEIVRRALLLYLTDDRQASLFNNDGLPDLKALEAPV